MLANLITKTESDYLFHDEDPEPIAALLDAALTQKLETGEIRNELTFRGIEDYSEEHMAGQFLSLAEELLHTRRPDHP